MIVREIAGQPELLEDFDWFNDYDDTRFWAETLVPGDGPPPRRRVPEMARRKSP